MIARRKKICKDRTRKTRFLSLLFLILINIPLNAKYELRHIETQLSNNAVLFTYQDNNGYMWFGTYDGLNLYNGKENLIYRYEEGNPLSLCSNIIHKISAAGKNDLWISTSLGLNKFSLTSRSVTEAYKDYPMAMLITSDDLGNTWMIAKGNSISFYNNNDNNRPRKFREIPIDHESINSGSINEQFIYHGKLHLITYDGRLLLISCNDFIDNRKPQISERLIHDSEIYKCYVKNELLYFIDRENKIYQYNLNTAEKHFLRDISTNINKNDGYISQITVLDNNIFVALKNKGVIRFNFLDQQDIEIINPETPVFCINPDRFQKIIWIGTDGQGVQQYGKSLSLFGQITNAKINLIKKPVRSLYTDRYSNLWIGTNGDGVLKIRNIDKIQNNNIDKIKADIFTSNNGLAHNQVYCFEKSRDENIFWIGCERPGLSYYSYVENKMRVVENKTNQKIENIHSIKEINDSTLFIASTNRGSLKITIDKLGSQYYIKSVKSIPLETVSGNICDQTQSMSYNNQSNSLMIGCRGGYGVARYDIRTDKYKFIPIVKGNERSAIGDVLCILQSVDSIYYIGSSSGLIKMKFLPNGKTTIKQFNKKNGLINDMIHGILEDDDGYIWFSTNSGLTKHNPQTDSFHNFVSPMLHVSEFSDDAYWKCPYTGRLYFGGVNGLVWVNKGSIEGVSSPNFHFFDIKIAKESIPLSNFFNKRNETIEIPQDVQTFSISFVALDFTSNNNYEYAYKLVKYNDNWIDINKNNEAIFTNLPYGEYVLKVKCKNDIANGIEYIYSLKIKKLAPWYRTHLAYAVYFILFIISCIYSIYLFKQKVKKRNRRILHRIEEEQRKELYESKLKFFTNITHEFYTPLTLIKGTCESLRNIKSEKLDESEKYIDILYKNADDLEKLINELLRFRKLDEMESATYVTKNVNIKNFLENFLQSYTLIAKESDIDLQIIIQENLIWNTDIASFQKIISNLVSNAFKYTPTSGSIKIESNIKDNNLIFKIANTGKGIEQSKLTTIFDRYSILEDVDVNKYSQLTSRTGLGLSICSSMIKLLHGTINVDSKLNEYTIFEVILPMLEGEIDPEIKTSLLKKQDIIISETNKPQILVVDDNKDIVWLLSDTLLCDYTIFKALNAEEALDILFKENISLVITDIMMPGMDGIEFVNKIKSNKIIRNIAIIIVSAKVTELEQQEGIKTGADVYLTKPFSLSILKSHVDRLIQKKEDLKNFYRSPESAYEYTQGSIIHHEDRTFIDQITSIIDKNITNDLLSPNFIAESLNLNSRTLYRKIKQITSLSVTDFIKNYRFTLAENLLITTKLTIQEVMFKVGISNKSYFYREFLKKNEVTPKDYRNTQKKDEDNGSLSND